MKISKIFHSCLCWLYVHMIFWILWLNKTYKILQGWKRLASSKNTFPFWASMHPMQTIQHEGVKSCLHAPTQDHYKGLPNTMLILLMFISYPKSELVLSFSFSFCQIANMFFKKCHKHNYLKLVSEYMYFNIYFLKIMKLW